MGKMPTNSLGKSSELKLHCFCLFDAYSMPKDMCSEAPDIGFLPKISQDGSKCAIVIDYLRTYCPDIYFVYSGESESITRIASHIWIIISYDYL